MLCKFKRASREARLRHFVALVHRLLALARLLSDLREPLRQRAAYFGQIGVLERSEASLNCGQIASAGLQVDTVHLDVDDSPELGALLYNEQRPRDLQALLAAPYQVKRQEGAQI